MANGRYYPKERLMKNLNKYRHWFWLAGGIGALILSRFINSKTFDFIVPQTIVIVLGVISVIGMIVLIMLGYILGRKLDKVS
jgi:hypothetical protein